MLAYKNILKSNQTFTVYIVNENLYFYDDTSYKSNISLWDPKKGFEIIKISSMKSMDIPFVLVKKQHKFEYMITQFKQLYPIWFDGKNKNFHSVVKYSGDFVQIGIALIPAISTPDLKMQNYIDKYDNLKLLI